MNSNNNFSCGLVFEVTLFITYTTSSCTFVYFIYLCTFFNLKTNLTRTRVSIENRHRAGFFRKPDFNFYITEPNVINRTQSVYNDFVDVSADFSNFFGLTCCVRQFYGGAVLFPRLIISLLWLLERLSATSAVDDSSGQYIFQAICFFFILYSGPRENITVSIKTLPIPRIPNFIDTSTSDYVRQRFVNGSSIQLCYTLNRVCTQPGRCGTLDRSLPSVSMQLQTVMFFCVSEWQRV